MTVRRGEIWIVDLGDPDGSEQGGVRPCLIVQNDVGNAKASTTIVCPISTTQKDLPMHVEVQLKRKSYIKTEQIRTIDKSRLKHFAGRISTKAVDEALKMTLGL